MITEYHRPDHLDEALALLGRPEPLTLPLGGGAQLNQPSNREFAVVDLQNLGLSTFQARGNLLELGATLTLGALPARAEAAGVELPAGLAMAIQREGTYNLRQVATVAGALVSADGRSPFALAMLALDAQLNLEPGAESISLGDLLPLRQERLRGHLITQVSIPRNVRLAYEYVSRSPADWHIVGAALAIWPSGRTRLALGGFGLAPLLAFDGGELEGLEIAAQSAYSQAGDQWASAEYRREMASVLVRRCREQLQSDGK
jgi:CO/xanthine dehydrogenase FAD-binding subunit